MNDHRNNHISHDGGMNDMQPTNAQIDEARLTAFALGELEDRFAGDMPSRMESDPSFRSEVEAVRAAADTLRAELRAEPAMELTALQRERVKQGPAGEPVAAGDAASERSILNRSRAIWGVVGLAAAACLVLVAFLPMITGENDGGLASGKDYREMGPGDSVASAPAIEESAAASRSNSRMDEFRAGGTVAGSATMQAPGEQKSEARPAAQPPTSPSAYTGDTRARSRTSTPPPTGGGGTLRGGGRSVPVPGTDAGGLMESERSEVALYEDQLRRSFEDGDEMDDRIGQEFDFNTEQYARIHDNPFKLVDTSDLPTFSIDVDTASYSNVRRFIMDQGILPPPDAVRTEELLNYFSYDYAPPSGDAPFSVSTEVSPAPWNPNHQLLKIGLKGKTIDMGMRKPTSITFLLDVSGSMNQPNKLPLVKQALKMLLNSLTPDDRIAIVVYAGNSGLVLPPTFCHDKHAILDALDRLRAGGSTNGGQGIQLAYKTAQEMFVAGGNNRVILCTDGDFNVGVSSDGDLERLIEQKRETGVFLTVLGFGTGNTKDSKMETLADKGNGMYAYIDSEREAKKVLVEEAGGSLVTIAKDVKIQVDFNPLHVQGYRLIGYENRMLAAEDFEDDTKDAGEIGAGHTVTALFEVVPVGATDVVFKSKPESKYAAAQPQDASKDDAGEGATGDEIRSRRMDDAEAGRTGGQAPPENAVDGDDRTDPATRARQQQLEREFVTVKLRYKEPDADASTPLEDTVVEVSDLKMTIENSSPDQQFAAAVAGFAMLLRNSEHKGAADFDQVLRLAEAGAAQEKSRRMLVLRFEDLTNSMRSGRANLAAGSIEALASAALTDAEWNWLLLDNPDSLARVELALRSVSDSDAFDDAVSLLRPHVDRVKRNAHGPRRPVVGPGYREEFVELVEKARTIAARAERDAETAPSAVDD